MGDHTALCVVPTHPGTRVNTLVPAYRDGLGTGKNGIETDSMQ